jgi:hypothetical protein
MVGRPQVQPSVNHPQGIAMSRIVGKKFIEALLESGVITKDEFVRRVVIDVSYDDAVVMHVERYGDSRLLEVIPALTGVEIRQTEKPAEQGFSIRNPNTGVDVTITSETLRQAHADDAA